MSRHPEKNGDKDGTQILLGIGYVTQKWEHLALRILMETAELIGGDTVLAQLALSQTTNASALISISRKVFDRKIMSCLDVDQALKSEARQKCKTVFERIRRLNKKRNKVIHGVIGDGTFRVDGKVVSGHFLHSPSIEASLLFDVGDRSYWLTGSDIVQIGDSLQECREQFNSECDLVAEIARVEQRSIDRSNALLAAKREKGMK